jgi:hypothetical protein
MQIKGNYNRRSTFDIAVDPARFYGVVLRNDSVLPALRRVLGRRLWTPGKFEQLWPLLKGEVERAVDRQIKDPGKRAAARVGAAELFRGAWSDATAVRTGRVSAVELYERALDRRIGQATPVIPAHRLVAAYRRALTKFGAREVTREPGDYQKLLNGEVQRRAAALWRRGLDVRYGGRDLSQFTVLDRDQREEHAASKALSNAMHDLLSHTAGRRQNAGVAPEKAVQQAVDRIGTFFFRAMKYHVRWSDKTSWDDVGQALVDSAMANAPELTGDVLQVLTTRRFNVQMPRAFDVAPVAARYRSPR